MVRMTLANSSVGESMGSVISRNWSQLLAPSTRALS